MTPIPRAVRHIVVIRTDRLGETILHLPMWDALRAAYPNARISCVAGAPLVELLRLAPSLDAVIENPVRRSDGLLTGAIRLARRLRAERADVVIISNPTKLFHVAAFLARVPYRIGWRRKGGAQLLTHAVADEKALGARHEVEYNAELLRRCGIAAPEHPQLTLPITEALAERVLRQLGAATREHPQDWIAVHPWTSNPAKQWPLERFRALVRELAAPRRARGMRVLVVGGPEEAHRAPEVVGDAGEAVVNLVGRLSLPELAACLRYARVLVSSDSGPVHLAAAVGTPVVALFGTADAGSHPQRWGPWGAGHTVIHQPLETIAVEQVTEAAARCVS